MLNSVEHEHKIQISHKSISSVVFILLLNVKMSTVIGILKFMGRINFMLSPVEYEKDG